MHIFPRNFQKLQVKLQTKLLDKSEEKYLQIFPKIRDLPTEIWQRLKVHTAFFLSTAELVKPQKNSGSESGD